MKIGIFLHPISKEKGGLERYIYETAKALIETDTTNQFNVYVEDNVVGGLDFEGTHWKPISHAYHSVKWRLFGYTREDSDVYIFYTPVLPPFRKFAKSVTIFFDAAFLYFGNKTLKGKIEMLKQTILQRSGMKRAGAVITISAASRKDAIEKLDIKREKIHVVYCGCTDICGKNEFGAIPVTGDYFLYTGPLKERKNVTRIVAAFTDLCKSYKDEIILAIAGRSSKSDKRALLDTVDDPDIRNRIQFLGYVSDSELGNLYANAKGFVFPSLFEGFGMPVLEAMQCGCPVITSKISSLPEVAGDAALLVSPYDISKITHAMRTLLTRKDIVDEMVQKGYKRSREFNWKHSAEEWIDIIERLMMHG